MLLKDLSLFEVRGLCYGDYDPEFFEIKENKLKASTRWSLCYDLVVQEKETGKHYKTVYRTGATEQQDEQPFEKSDPKWVEVKPEEETIIVYKEIKND